jgi:hypothetical protein
MRWNVENSANIILLEQNGLLINGSAGNGPQRFASYRRHSTTDMQYDPARTGLLLVDPYNDFLASEGKLWPFAKEVAEAVNLLAHLAFR